MQLKIRPALIGILLAGVALAGPESKPVIAAAPHSQSIVLAGKDGIIGIVVDPDDYPVVTVAANFLADDIERVSGHRPVVTNKPSIGQIVIAGTLGHSNLIDQLVAEGKLKDTEKIRGRWEASLSQIVDRPLPGVARALVIAGSDRRGAAYGLMRLSENIGVSAWYWWADVPVQHRDIVTVKLASSEVDAPAVKYRGIFINDEDWGLSPWAKETFDPKFGNIGPKTYEKVFELMLRLRLNYIWPAMHAVTTEFGAVPENVALADKFGIVVGSSHCEPMLANNVHWNETTKGKWDYTINRDAIHSYWKENVKARGNEEAVWTLGIRGIHDRPMEGPDDTATRIKTVTQVLKDERALLDENVSTQWGPVAQDFVPYKEVLPIYDAGLNVPPDVTLVWVDDNFGYIRRLSSPDERKRPGGSGVYWHLSYYGGPHSYTWINTTAPALMWEELHKAWENDARTLWVINVGDIKPAEIDIDYFSRLAWNPDAFGPESQPVFLRNFVARNFGEQVAKPVADLLMEFYRLGTVRKPELMNRHWAVSLSAKDAADLDRDYQRLLATEKSTAAAIPVQSRDAYSEMIGFPARILGSAGLVFMADRRVQEGKDVAANEREVSRLRDYMDSQVREYNTGIAGGKWNYIMPGLVTAKDLTSWSSQVRWPWGERAEPHQPAVDEVNGQAWRDAADADRKSEGEARAWRLIEGLGQTGRAIALLPTSIEPTFAGDSSNAPALEFDFTTKGGDAEALVDFLPTFRIYPGMKLRVAISVDRKGQQLVEVPGSSGAEDERGSLRRAAVQDNYVRIRVPLPGLSAGKHTLKIVAVDPAIVIDRVSLP